MENAKKMIIISPEELQRIQTPQPQQLQQGQKFKHSTGGSNTISELDREMLSLLNNKYLSDQEKWSQYQQVLQRYLHFTNQKRQPIQIPVVDVVNNLVSKHNVLKDEELIGTFTKTYKGDVKNILNHIGRRPDKIDWDDNGTVYIDGGKVQDSNIIDLLHDIIRARKATQPPGWEQLMYALRDISTPTEFITNPFARQYLVRLKGASSQVHESNLSTPTQASLSVKEDISTPSPSQGPNATSTPLPKRMRRGQERIKWETFKFK